jgi:2,4-dienoyl-CoA reductase-like NADH-dependent reductase (Old Yellow Enzyme family)/thioredoxin reductase
MTQQFPLLFAPFRLGKHDLQSRIVVTGHATHFYDKQKLPTEDYAYYLRERAKGGAGMVTLGSCAVHPNSTYHLINQDERIIPRYQRIAKLVHEFPVPVLAQLGHIGRAAAVRQRQVLDGDWLSVAPSAVPTPAFSYVQAMPHAMSTEEVEEMVAAFGAAAGRVRDGGLDGAELVVGAGNLVAQFLHSQSNLRTDKYGGATLVERMTFLYEVLRAMREALGPELLLGVRIYDDLVSYSIDYEDGKTISPLLEATGLLDYMNVWIGHIMNNASFRAHWPSYYHAPGEFAERPAGIKQLVSLPVIGAGRINTPVLAEWMLTEGKMDLVGMVRELIADPHFPNKAREGRVEDIRMCIACVQSCVGRHNLALPITCIYNPVTGHEKQWADLGPAPVEKKVVVVGGGPAGMEAARVAAERGHQVVLFEASDRLGGEIKLAMLPPMRESFEEIIKFFERQLPKLEVEVRLNTEASIEKVLAERPDAVIVATGAIPYIPEIPGVQGGNVITCNDVLNGSETGEHVVVIDTQGTPPGCTVAEVLADEGKRVEIITGLNWVGSDIPGPVWNHLYERLLGKGVVMSPMTGVSRIGEDFVEVYHVVNPSVTRTIRSVDTVVMAAGGQANDGLHNSLIGKIDELYTVGDSAQPRNIEMATYQAHKVAVEL